MWHKAFNIVCAAVGLVLLSPVFAVLAIIIKSHDCGPVFYRSKRVGQKGDEFLLFKFRSMVVGADKGGMGLTVPGDSRITSVGRLLRRTKLDELPQLINVLVGNMNLVGPRPEDPRFVSMYSVEQRRILDFKPGMTSPASLFYRNEEEFFSAEDNLRLYVEQLMPKKIEMDLAYLDHQDVLQDTAIIVRTILAIV